MSQVKMYFKLLSCSFRCQMQHRASFFMLAFAHFLSTLVDIIGIWVLFDRFKIIKGWSFAELALIYGMMHMGFAVAEAFARGFDTFSQIVKSGEFDRLLLRPISTLVQVASREVQIMRVGRFIQGLLVLVWGCSELGIALYSLNALIILLAIIGIISLFYALFIIQATLAFWTTETLELMHIVTYGGLESGQYPMHIYKPWFKGFFTFIIPLACVAYYPVAIILKQEDLPFWLGMITPLAGIAFLYLACQLWNFGVCRYQSTGS
jgi:ABC-2 type transport system permease protein